MRRINLLFVVALSVFLASCGSSSVSDTPDTSSGNASYDESQVDNNPDDIDQNLNDTLNDISASLDLYSKDFNVNVPSNDVIAAAYTVTGPDSKSYIVDATSVTEFYVDNEGNQYFTISIDNTPYEKGYLYIQWMLSDGSTQNNAKYPIAVDFTREDWDNEKAESHNFDNTWSEDTDELVGDEVSDEIRPDIPIGTMYELGQGSFVVGEDIPEGRYKLMCVGGNSYGGYLSGRGRYIRGDIMIDADIPYYLLFEDGDTFDIDLVTIRFEKISSVKNDFFLQEDGSYLLGSGIFFEDIDIPCGTYDVTAVGGNSYGITIDTSSKSFIMIDQGETYSNLKLNSPRKEISIDLGVAKFVKK